MLDVLTEPLHRGRYARAAALTAVAVAALFAAMAASRLIWAIVGMGDDPLPPPAPRTAEALAAEAEARGSVDVGQWHLFGNALPARDPRALASVAPDTGLALVLRGIFAGDDPKAGRAIIGDRDGNDRSFSVGDAISDGVTLDGVYADRVTLSRGGQIEALRLPRDDAAALAAPRPASRTRVIDNGRPAAGAGVVGEPVVGEPVVGAPGSAAQPFVNPVMSMNTDQYARATAALGVDPAQLAQQVSVMPVLENGKFVGVRLSAARDVPAIAKLGLQPDDVVTSVNGITLDSPARATEVAASLQNASSINVTVRRNGRTENLSVSLR